ncbi:hypothetical protein T4D_5302 [Trichinella pseudospiralis]|uniref:Uncharacterized protein n=1 Tax=Trichinella pseudospiralis TaxID=6337 RepID=A0A0V1FF66_TRIPS|nr:hypothetical protein T4D_5302 [Trichinella pseudospiralis]
MDDITDFHVLQDDDDDDDDDATASSVVVVAAAAAAAATAAAVVVVVNSLSIFVLAIAVAIEHVSLTTGLMELFTSEQQIEYLEKKSSRKNDKQIVISRKVISLWCKLVADVVASECFQRFKMKEISFGLFEGDRKNQAFGMMQLEIEGKGGLAL